MIHLVPCCLRLHDLNLQVTIARAGALAPLVSLLHAENAEVSGGPLDPFGVFDFEARSVCLDATHAGDEQPR